MSSGINNKLAQFLREAKAGKRNLRMYKEYFY